MFPEDSAAKKELAFLKPEHLRGADMEYFDEIQDRVILDRRAGQYW